MLALYCDILSWAVAKEEVSAEFGCEAKDVQSLLDARQRQRRNQAPRRRRRAKLRRTYPFLSCSVLPVAFLFVFFARRKILVEVPDGEDLTTFSTDWVSAVSDLEGNSAKMVAELLCCNAMFGCHFATQLVLTRLDSFEFQEQLVQFLKQATAGMAQCRRQMGDLNEANITPEAVEDVLCVAKPYLLAYKKHSATAANLLTGCTIYRRNLRVCFAVLIRSEGSRIRQHKFAFVLR